MIPEVAKFIGLSTSRLKFSNKCRYKNISSTIVLLMCKMKNAEHFSNSEKLYLHHYLLNMDFISRSFFVLSKLSMICSWDNRGPET